MARIIVTEFISLDGIMDSPGGDNGFSRGAWTFEHDRGEQGDKFKAEETMGAEALLLGRKTYDGFSQAWPTVEGAFADKFNTMPKYVFSSTLSDPEWANTTVISGDLVEETAKLRDQVEGDIIVHGSGQLVRGLLAADLVDELRLMVFPVILGTGMRMFGDTDEAMKLSLTSSEFIDSGVGMLVYERAA